MKNTIRTKILCTLAALAVLSGALIVSGCSQPNSNLPESTLIISYPQGNMGNGTTYTINGTKCSDEYWASFVNLNFSAYDKVIYRLITSGTYSNTESLWFTVTDGKLNYTYESTYSSFNEEILGFNNKVESSDNGFVLLLHTDNNHKNWEKGACAGIPKNIDDTQNHSCYIPIYFSLSPERMINASYYSDSTACFYKMEDALNHMEYDSSIYGFATSYPKL